MSTLPLVVATLLVLLATPALRDTQVEALKIHDSSRTYGPQTPECNGLVCHLNGCTL